MHISIGHSRFVECCINGNNVNNKILLYFICEVILSNAIAYIKKHLSNISLTFHSVLCVISGTVFKLS